MEEANKSGGGDNISLVLIETEKGGKWDKLKKLHAKEG